MSSKSKRYISLAVILLAIVAPLAVWTQRWNIYDALRLRNYQASAEVAQVATDTAMNDDTRQLFYVYYPEFQDKQAFNNSCKSSEKTIVLGCYVSGNGIYLYNVTDARLNGIKQVTAAHETLHAAYERLSSREKAHVNNLLEDAFEKIDNQRIKDTIEDYRKNGADITNELHSILGTEVRNLPPELEQYYTRYFTNRLKIVEYSEKYEQAFNERKQKVAEADKKLASLKQAIEAGESQLNILSDGLKSERQRLDGLLANKDYDSYNAAVPGFNSRVSAYNRQVGQVGSLIDQYNALVAERNAIATEESELVKAIDSRPDTLQTH